MLFSGSSVAFIFHLDDIKSVVLFPELGEKCLHANLCDGSLCLCVRHVWPLMLVNSAVRIIIFSLHIFALTYVILLGFAS